MGFLTKRITILRQTSLFASCALVLALWGCSENAPKPADTSVSQPKTNQFETGRFALQKMLPAAHMWASDAAPVNLASSTSAESDGHDGKAGSWRGVFASPARQKA